MTRYRTTQGRNIDGTQKELPSFVTSIYERTSPVVFDLLLNFCFCGCFSLAFYICKLQSRHAMKSAGDRTTTIYVAATSISMNRILCLNHNNRRHIDAHCRYVDMSLGKMVFSSSFFKRRMLFTGSLGGLLPFFNRFFCRHFTK